MFNSSSSSKRTPKHARQRTSPLRLTRGSVSRSLIPWLWLRFTARARGATIGAIAAPPGRRHCGVTRRRAHVGDGHRRVVADPQPARGLRLPLSSQQRAAVLPLVRDEPRVEAHAGCAGVVRPRVVLAVVPCNHRAVGVRGATAVAAGEGTGRRGGAVTAKARFLKSSAAECGGRAPVAHSSDHARGEKNERRSRDGRARGGGDAPSKRSSWP